jgi:outer membrane protein OmpA-like peptidoglycan-associated protein/Tol biopolymer transport system component
MTKILHAFLMLFMLLSSACSTAQMAYSTKDKKAIKFFEEGQKAPNLALDQRTGRPDYASGLAFMKKAIERDPNFWEAYVFAGEFCEYMGNRPDAIFYYEAALHLNPNHSSSGSTYFFLANLLFLEGDYNACLKNIEIFEKNRNANPDLLRESHKLRQNCDFSIQSIAHPLRFKPINLGPGVNTSAPEYYPTITVDGKVLLFTRRIPDERVPIYKAQEDFYYSLLNDQSIWTTAQAMPNNINTVLNEGAPTIGPDGRSLVFVACSDLSGDNDYGENRTGRGSCDLFITKRIGQRWTDPTNLPGNINSVLWESQPSLSADGKTLYFIRRVSRKGEPKNMDIFVSRLLDNGQWSTPEVLPNYINTPYVEESVLIHPDGKTLYFASRGHVGMGGSDLYVCRLTDKGTWSAPMNLGYPINTQFDENSLLVSADGEIAFFASDREGGFGDLDIYQFELPEEFRPTKTLYFEGIVFDVTTKKPLPGKFQLIDLKTGKEVVFSEADKVSGEFMVSLPVNREYALNVTYPGYSFFSKNFNMTNPEGLEAIHMDVPMIPITSDLPVVLANVFFDLTKATLRQESFVELEKLLDFMTKNPSMKIEISGHTDTRGDDKENMKLSADRAKSVYDYLVSKGISADRLTYKGYGESMPMISDAEISKLATEKEREAAHQSNRRTEYRVVK